MNDGVGFSRQPPIRPSPPSAPVEGLAVPSGDRPAPATDGFLFDERILSLSQRSFSTVAAAAAAVGRELFELAEVRVQPISEGANNEAFIVTAPEGEQAAILRLSAASRAERGYEKEALVLDQVGTMDALRGACARCLAVGHTDVAGKRTAFMAQSRLPGLSGAKVLESNPSAAPDLWRQIGGFASAIRTHSAPGFGTELRARGQLHFADRDWFAYIRPRIRGGLGVLESHDGPHIPLLLEKWKQRVDGLETWTVEHRLGHGDLGPHNVLVDTDSMKVTGVVDWGSAGSLHPHADLANVYALQGDGRNLAAFLSGYGMNRDAFEAILDQIEPLSLVYAAGLLGWSKQRGYSGIADLCMRRIESMLSD